MKFAGGPRMHSGTLANSVILTSNLHRLENHWMIRNYQRSFALLTLALLGAVLSGCGKDKPPPLTTVEGTVTVNGKPLPFAQVEFQPDLPKFKGAMNSYATTDEKGHYTLTCGYKQQAGATVGQHRVLISEQPVPEEYRSLDGETREKYTRYIEKLDNRPIPSIYSGATTTPLKVDVAAGKSTYDLTLTR
jgi:hypothetical protein